MSPELEAASRIHIVGAGGAGMSGLAKLLAGMGHTVTGSDLKPGRALGMLGDLGIETWIGHDPARIDGTDLVVASSAVPESDPELVAAVAAGIPVWRRPTLLNALTAHFPTLGITGTHGKTTTTALVVTALNGLGLDPTFLVGGEMIGQNTSAHLGDPSLFVLEADEAFGTFRHLYLNGLIVTNIEADHLDYYGSVAALEEAFALVANRTRGPVIGCVDDPGVRRLAERCDLIGYGTGPGARWRIVDLTHDAGTVGFRLEGADGSAAVKVPRPGMHIARDTAGAIALLAELGHDPQQVADALSGFAGVRRRFEVKARIGGVTIVDDYAHHPTEVAATIAAGRLGGWKRIWAVFQPHRYTRTADLGPLFGSPLATADRVIVTDVYPAGEVPQPGVTGRIVASATSAAGGAVEYVPTVDAVTDVLLSDVRSGDLILLLGAGDVNRIADQIAAALGRS